MSTASQSQVVATVISVTGVAFARNADGAVRRLAAGDTILEGETVFTLAGGEVELAFADGHHATILASESYLIGPEAMVATSPDAGEAAITAAGEIGKIVTALEEGGDILEGLEAPAAGGAGEDSGNDFVRLLRIVEPVTPVGYEFPINTVEQIEAPEGDVIPEEEEEEPENNAPVVGGDSTNVSEEGLLPDGLPDTEGDPDTTNEYTQSGTISVSDPDGDPLTVTLVAPDPDPDLTSGGVQITWELSPDGKTLTGSAGDTEIIEITIDDGGNWTVTLLGPLDHPDPDDEDAISFDVTVSATDGSLTSTGTLAITVEDDSPTLTVEAAAGASRELAVELDETVGDDRANDSGETADGNDDDAADVLAQVTTGVEGDGGLLSLFSLGGDYGADGPGTTSGALSFIGIPEEGLETTLSATDGGTITLFMDSDDIVGKDGDGDVVFRIEIVNLGTEENPDYQLRTTLYEAIDHGDDDNLFDATVDLLTAEGTVQLEYEVTRTDDDGDEVTESEQIDLITSQTTVFSFDDDGPEITSFSTNQVSIVLDESVGTGGSTQDEPGDADPDDETAAGAPVGAIGYATVAGDDLFSLTVDGGSDGEDTDARVFALTLDWDGENPVDSGLDATDGGDIMLSMDGNGDILGMDGDTLVFKISIDSETGDTTVAQYEAIDHGDDDNNHDSQASMLSGLVGATVTVYDNDGDAVTADSVELGDLIAFEDDGPILNAIQQGVLSANSTVLTGNIDFDAGSDDFGSYILNGTAPEGVTYKQYHDGDDLPDGVAATLAEGEVLLVATWSSDGSIYFTLQLKADGTYAFNLVNAPEGEPIEIDLAGIPSGSYDYLRYDADTETWGANQGSIAGDVALADAEVIITGSEVISVSGAGFGVGNNQFDSGDELYFEFTDPVKSVTLTTQRNAGTASGDQLVVYWVAYNDGFEVASGYLLISESLEDPLTNYQTLVIDPGVTFDELVIDGITSAEGAQDPSNVDGTGTFVTDDDTKVTFTDLTVNYGLSFEDQDLSFDIAIVDGDGDITATDELNIHIEADEQTEGDGFILTGSSASDALVGSEGDDVLIGGAGSDTLTGDLGADTFVWNLADKGTVGTPAMDTVTDFEAGDILELDDLLPNADTADYLYVTQNASGTTIHITDGSGVTDGTADVQTIFLDGYTAESAATILAKLVSDQGYTGV